MKNKFLLLSAFIVVVLSTSCTEKHKNFGARQEDTVKVGDSTNSIENTVPPNDTLKH